MHRLPSERWKNEQIERPLQQVCWRRHFFPSIYDSMIARLLSNVKECDSFARRVGLCFLSRGYSLPGCLLQFAGYRSNDSSLVIACGRQPVKAGLFDAAEQYPCYSYLAKQGRG